VSLPRCPKCWGPMLPEGDYYPAFVDRWVCANCGRPITARNQRRREARGIRALDRARGAA
jgi:hypothetical protein